MAVPAWFWPQGGVSALTVAAALQPSGILVADWRTDTFYRFNGSFAASFSGTATQDAVGGSGAVVNTTNGTIAVSSYDGPVSQVANGSTTVTQTTLPSGEVYVGAAIAASTLFTVSSTGGLFGVVSQAALGPGINTTPTWDLVGNATTAYTLAPTLSAIGTFAGSTGATGTIALPAPLATPYCLAVSGTTGSFLAVGGTSNATLVSGAGQTAFALNPANTTLLLGVDNGTATIWLTSATNQFTVSTSATGIGAATFAAWTPNGTQALVTNGSAVEVLHFSAGALTLAQTLSLTGAGAVVVMPTGTDALVVQHASSQVSTLALTGGTWSVTGSLASPSGGPAVILTPTQVAVGIPGSIQLINLINGAWALAGNIALSFAPTQLAVDAAGVLYACAANTLAVIASGAVTGTATWSGTPGGMIAVADQVAIADSANSLIKVFGSDNGTTWTQRTTTPMPGGFTGFGIAGQTVLAAGSGSAALFNFGAPYTLANVPQGAAGLWNGTAWTTAALGAGQTPSAITIDASGNAEVATVQNNLYTMTPAGALTSATVPQSSGQAQNVPLGTSALIVSGASLFAGTSMAGVLVQVR